MTCKCERPNIARVYEPYDSLGRLKFRPVSVFYCLECGAPCDPEIERMQNQLLGLKEKE